MIPKYDDFINKKEKIVVLGLGYVGLPLAAHLAAPFDVIGFDVNTQRVADLENGHDVTGEMSTDDLSKSDIAFTTDAAKIKEGRFIIATVPTPIDKNKRPNLNPIKDASKLIGENLAKGSVIVFESTVYPGVTEEICAPIIEEHSGLKCGVDFKMGYSPERINPGDKKHTVAKIIKVVAGQDDETLELVSQIYGKVITAGVHKTSDIKTAEAAKVIENIQRDLNIALMNELALIFHKLDIDTNEVIEAAGTKWNFLKFVPGLVGGHCIGVDPYYLTYKAEEIGYHPTIILSGRRVNDYMGKYIAEQTIKRLIDTSKPVKGAKVLILGITFKENIKDIRNTKVVDIYNELKEYGADLYVYDPNTIHDEVMGKYGIEMISDPGKFKPYDAVVYAVKHKQFSEYDPAYLKSLMGDSPVLIDVKGMFKPEEAESAGLSYWRL